MKEAFSGLAPATMEFQIIIIVGLVACFVLLFGIMKTLMGFFKFLKDHASREEDEIILLRRAIDNQLIRTAPIILFAINKEGIFTLSEGKALDLIGLRPTEAVGQSVYELYKDHTQVLASIKRALDGETFSDVIKVGGAYLETVFTPLRGPSGVSGLIGCAVDVTARILAEDELKKLLAKSKGEKP